MEDNRGNVKPSELVEVYIKFIGGDDGLTFTITKDACLQLKRYYNVRCLDIYAAQGQFVKRIYLNLAHVAFMT